MTLWFERLSIRTRIVLLALVILLPAAGAALWYLGADLAQVRASATARVAILADSTAGAIEHRLGHVDTLLARLARRPAVVALDPARCDPMLADTTALVPELHELSLRDARGRALCGGASPPSPEPQDATWPATALRQVGLAANVVAPRPGSARQEVLLTYPVRDAAGAAVGLLVAPLDLVDAVEPLLASMPAHAVIRVVDRDQVTVLQWARAEALATGDAVEPVRAEAGPPLPALVDGGPAPRLAATSAVLRLGWSVSASLPEDDALADYRAALRRTAGIGLALFVLGVALAGRLGAAIVRPIEALARVASDVAGGQRAARASVDGPPDVASVAQQFNRMLDVRDAAEAQQRDSESRYRKLFDGLPEAISIHCDGIVAFVNPACVDLLGARRAADLLGRMSIDFVRPDLRPGTLVTVAETLERRGSVANGEQVFVRVDGSEVEVEVCAATIDYEGRPAILTSMRDITERKRTELALARSEAQMRGIFESATVAIITADETQTIVKANPAAAATFRCTVDKLVGVPLERLIPARHRGAHSGQLQRFGESADGSRQMGRTRGVTALRGDGDGEEFPIDAAISHLSIGGQRLYTVILRDTTERHRAEAALRESEANLRRLLFMLPDAVFVNSGGRVTFVNEAMLRLFDTDEATMLGRPALELIHTDSQDLVRVRIASLRGGLAITQVTLVKIVRPDGSTRLVESSATLVGDHDEGSIAFVLRDVSELSEAREALAESHAELQRLVAAQDRVQEDERKRIARELHDDLQQTLAAIRIDLAAIEQGLPHSPDTMRPLLAETGDLAVSAIESTRRIINDLRPQMLEDLGLIPAIEALLRQFGRRTGITCHFEVQTADGANVPMSPNVATCLYRVTQEALGNVARHAQASEVTVRLAGPVDGLLNLHLSDNGRGMVTGERRKPASFGLLGMRERVGALGGVVRIDSVPGAGLTIDVVVPSGESAPAGDAARANVAGAVLSEAAEPLLAGIVDALEGNVAVLDRDGVIRLVNQAWREFASHNGDPSMAGSGPGASYLEVCRRAAPFAEDARAALDGLTAVLAGQHPAFVHEYRCDSPQGQRWFRMHVARLDASLTLVTHVHLGHAGGPEPS